MSGLRGSQSRLNKHSILHLVFCILPAVDFHSLGFKAVWQVVYSIQTLILNKFVFVSVFVLLQIPSVSLEMRCDLRCVKEVICKSSTCYNSVQQRANNSYTLNYCCIKCSQYSDLFLLIHEMTWSFHGTVNMFFIYDMLIVIITICYGRLGPGRKHVASQFKHRRFRSIHLSDQ